MKGATVCSAVAAMAYQLLQTGERCPRVVRVDGRDPAGVPGIPCLQERQGLAAPHLPDNDTIRPHAQRRPEQPRHADLIGSPHDDRVFLRALDLGRVLDDDEALVPRDVNQLSNQGVRQRGLAARGPAAKEDVLPFLQGGAQIGGSGRGKDAGGHIVVQGIDRDGALSDGEGRRGNNRGDHPLEPLAVLYYSFFSMLAIMAMFAIASVRSRLLLMQLGVLRPRLWILGPWAALDGAMLLLAAAYVLAGAVPGFTIVLMLALALTAYYNVKLVLKPEDRLEVEDAI